MERTRVLIADDDKAHLETVFDIVNAQDPLTPEGKIWTGKGRLVEEDASDRSAREFPLRVDGNIEILCAHRYEEVRSLIEEHGDIDICITDIQFSGERADGPSILSVCGVGPQNGILYTSQPREHQVYEGRGIYIEDKKEYHSTDKNRFRIIRYGTEDFEYIINRFLMDSEYLLAENRIQSSHLSSQAKASWRTFKRELNKLLSGGSPDRGDLRSCRTALTLEGGLEETRFGSVQFKHLFPFRDAFLNRRLNEVEAILDDDADEAYPSWSRIKNKTKVCIREIDQIIKKRESVDSEESEGESEEEPREVYLDLNSKTGRALKVKTNYDNEYFLSDISNMGIFLLLAVKIRDSKNIPVNGPVSRNYKRWSPPLVLSGILMDEIRNARGKYTRIVRKRFKYKSFEKKDLEGEGPKEINKSRIKASDILDKSFQHEEESWIDGENLVENYQISIMSPSEGSNHVRNVRKSAPEGVPDSVADILEVDNDYELSPEIEKFRIYPKWIEEGEEEVLRENISDMLS
jgi:hypothetical protein